MEAMMMQFKDLQIIPFEEITEATNNFHEDNYLGGGGFGNVYKGELSRFKERGLVAFKRLDRQYGQGETEFLKEISTLSQYKHENLIALLGYCIKEREMILVYEYTAHGSLDFHLGSRELTWTQRLKICLQAAEGLRYLHDPNGAHHKLIHRDIKSGNILLDEKWNAKVADLGLSKISPEKANLVTVVRGTPGYTDPEYHETYMLTEHSDVYSFGITLFEVLCGSLCYETIGENNVRVFVRKWKESYQENRLEEIIFKELDMKQIDPSSIKFFADTAYQCLNKSGKERPTMAEVVSKLKAALETQEVYDMILKHPLAKKYEKIVRTVQYRSIEELKECLSEGVLVNGGKTWLSLNDKGEHHVMVSIKEYLSLDDPNRHYNDGYSSKEKSRFAVGCYKKCLMKMKLRVTTPLFLSPDVTYGLNLVLHANEIEGMKQQCVGVCYKIQGETKISMMHFADKKEGKQLVVELYQFNNTEESILDLEIFLEDCGLPGDFYIEGIEFRPLEKVERQVVIANLEIVRGGVFSRFTEESKVFLSQGVLLNSGKTVELPVLEEYQDIVKVASQSLFYTSLDELKQILSQGVLLNGFKTVENRTMKKKIYSTLGKWFRFNNQEEEDSMFEDDKVEDTQTISDSGILKLSSDTKKWKMKKNLCSCLGKWFQFNKDTPQEWFTVDKHAKKCLILSARATRVIDDKNSACESSESRFGDVLVISPGYKFEIKREVKSSVISPETSYAAYLVFKLPQDQSTFEAPILVKDENAPNRRYSFIYLLSPPGTPVIGPKFDENTYNPLNRYKGDAIPQQRTDGWMEVKVWEFQTTTESVPMRLNFEHIGRKNFKGLRVKGIELRPI
ncbi:mitogen-activated protein (MAP) kinase 10, Phloem protein 2-like protein [Artemisia annua]|uniref:Mitogen-activated protein (MAP) kinase 10, Phloem protein 2-like protein n=1 Tax=Artemisia annua TaxID=35608 RepID=A0A2U1ME65_ARTAN|nr:mitogen-activated protein (MAP) kinase 10, Phloem protein 2-like protein [Artemisia annua]